ncbi:MAG: hypothetical protein JSS96_02670 [Bacteroidetes bacterium]|nr:hypothetical protein [Bacteroidota bacterium]
MHTNLSKKYNFKESLYRPTPGVDNEIISVTVRVIDKLSKKQIQEIIIKPSFVFSDVFVNCNSVRSYTTGVNKNKKIIDNDFGDIIVADFNFDSKEDFALKEDSGGNSGPTYNFYIQNSNGRFVLDTFLTNQMGFFPSHINRSNRTLVASCVANAYRVCETTYKLDAKGTNWKKIKRRFIPD